MDGFADQHHKVYLGPELNGMKANGSIWDDAPTFGSKRSGLNSFGLGNTDGLRNAAKSVSARLESAGITRPSSVEKEKKKFICRLCNIISIIYKTPSHIPK